MSAEIPAKFTGHAAMGPQDEKKFTLEEHAYTPRKFDDDDVIIKIECCGVCGTDVHVITCGWEKHDRFPAIVGHEIIGRVVKAGPNSGHKVGDRVGYGAECGSCRECDNCKNNLENYCLKGNRGTYQGKTNDSVQPFTQGGYADYYQASGHFAIPIPDELESTVAAPMLCAGVTVYSPLKRWGAGPGKKVGIVGIGGLGHLGLQFSKALGADTYALSHSKSKEADAAKLGAKGFIATADKEAVLAKHRNSFDILLMTSYQDNMPLADFYLPLLKIGGNMVIVGLPNSGLPSVPARPLFGKSLSGSLIGSPAELRDMFKLAVEKGVKTWVETRPMKDANQVLDDFAAGKPRYRYVLVNDN
jgi:alcohol dehydrogenase (NADP+)